MPTDDEETAVEDYHYVPSRSRHLRLVGRFSRRASVAAPYLPLGVNNVQDHQPTIDSAGAITNPRAVSGAIVTLNNTITNSPELFYDMDLMEQIRQKRMLLRYHVHLASEHRSLTREIWFLRSQIRYNADHAEMYGEPRFTVYSTWRCERDIRAIYQTQRKIMKKIRLVKKDAGIMDKLVIRKQRQLEMEKREALRKRQLELEGRRLGTKRVLEEEEEGEGEDETERMKRLRIEYFERGDKED